MTVIEGLHIGLSGQFKFIRRKADLSIVEETPWMRNIVTWGGLDRIGGRFGDSPSSNSGLGCKVGTGNTPELITDSNIEAFLAGTNTILSTTRTMLGPPYIVRITESYRFGVGVAAGNISEVALGIGSSTGGVGPTGTSAGGGLSPIHCRTLTRDEGGLPTTITVLDDEILDVVYQFNLHVPMEDITGTFPMDILGTTIEYNYVIRAAAISSTVNAGWQVTPNMQFRFLGRSPITNQLGTRVSSGELSTIPNTPTNIANSNITSFTNAPYIDGTAVRSVTFTWGLSVANFGFITYLLDFYSCIFQMQITPGVTKNNTQIFSTTFLISWGNLP